MTDKKQSDLTKIFFATDLHGSDRVFMKFVNFVKMCQANIAIIGGDVTGKALVPIVEKDDGTFYAFFQGQDRIARDGRELEELERNINTNGMYSFRAKKEKIDILNANEKELKETFLALMSERLRSWLRILEERLKPLGVKTFITGGNDDDPELDDVLRSSSYVVDSEGIVVALDDCHEMISTGYGNITPWRCPRDITEEELSSKIESMASKVKNMPECVFNLHVPPIDTVLDLCPRLDTRSYPPKPVVGETTNGGSTAVRESIQRYQPLAGLHGHIHESKGVDRIKKTTCFNPGSEYAEGVLKGVIINLGKGKIRSFQFISG